MRLIDADALSEKLCETTIFIKDGEVFQRMINDAPTVSAEAVPHGRLIDADMLEKELSKRWDISDDQDFSNKEVWEALRNAQTIKAVQGWIPCSERLPSDNREVLISCEWGIDIGQHEEYGWRSEWINHYDDDNVIAWMPLPKPYREDGEA